MIDVKTAVAAATEAAKEFYTGKEASDPDLEEVELSEDQSCWLITRGFHVRNKSPGKSVASEMMTEGPERYERKYKVFRINAEPGEMLSMKIREM